MSTSPVPAIIDAMVTALAASNDLIGVTVRSGPFDATGVTEVVQFDEIVFNDEQESMGMGNRALDFEVRGIVECVKHGAGETVIADARERAFEIMDAVEGILISGLSVTDTDLRYAEIRSGKYVPLLVDGGHRGHLEFSVHLIAGLG